MAYLKAIYKDYSCCCKNFSDGIEYLQQRAINEASHNFQLACNLVSESSLFRNKYISYLGFARLLNGDLGAIKLCRQAAKREFSDGDVFLNLARAEFLLNSRQRAIHALQRGLEIDSSHEGLQLMRKRLGIRKRKPLPFLPRGHAFNNRLGLLLRRK